MAARCSCASAASPAARPCVAGARSLPAPRHQASPPSPAASGPDRGRGRGVGVGHFPHRVQRHPRRVRERGRPEIRSAAAAASRSLCAAALTISRGDQEALREGIPVVQDTWVTACQRARRAVAWKAHRLPPFVGLHLSLTGIPFGERRCSANAVPVAAHAASQWALWPPAQTAARALRARSKKTGEPTAPRSTSASPT